MKMFNSPYEQYKQYNGKSCDVVGKVDPYTYNYEDVGDLYTITFEDGITIEAWPEEIGL